MRHRIRHGTPRKLPFHILAQCAGLRQHQQWQGSVVRRRACALGRHPQQRLAAQQRALRAGSRRTALLDRHRYAHVDFAALVGGLDGAAFHDRHVQPYLRVLLVQTSQHARHVAGPKVIRNEQPQFAAQRHATQIPVGLVAQGQDGARMLQQAFARGRGRHPGFAAHQQGLAGALFQFAHLFADRRLRQENLRRRRRQAARVQHGDQGAQLVQIKTRHGSIQRINRWMKS
ncbi:hypothetical protein D3C87_1504500 [compost metagenome]